MKMGNKILPDESHVIATVGMSAVGRFHISGSLSMIRKMMFGFTVAAMAGLTIGCTEAKKDDAPKKTGEYVDRMKDEANKRGEQIKEGVAKGAEGAAKAAEMAAEKAKEEVIKPIEALYPKIEEKIKALTGDAGTKATAAFEALKKLVTEFKAAPADKIKELTTGLTTKVDELKKLVGL
jgi:hypothetical protein